MTGRQKVIIAVLAFADVAVVLGLVFLTVRFRASPAEPPVSPLPLDCRREAVRQLARAGVGGTVTGEGGRLRFDLEVPLAPTEAVTAGVERAAQTVWTAFDCALSLREREECAVFSTVVVSVAVVEGGQAVGHVSAQVSPADLLAFQEGRLTEAEFIERVAYVSERR